MVPGSQNKTKKSLVRAGRVAQVVACLPGKLEALSSTPRTSPCPHQNNNNNNNKNSKKPHE
jgi:hypothetical protein